VEAEPAQAVWLTADQEFSLPEFAALSGLPEEALRELVDYGALEPVNADSAQWKLSGKCLPTRPCGLPTAGELRSRSARGGSGHLAAGADTRSGSADDQPPRATAALSTLA
jgi:hypothetical protein